MSNTSPKWNEKIIETEIFKVMKILNIDRMPTSLELRSLNINGLSTAVEKYGGYVYWAGKLNISLKKPIRKWKDNDIKYKILEIKDKLGIDRMPTRKEMIKLGEDESLIRSITKGLGFYKWAELLNLDIKDCETTMGIKFQEFCMNKLNDMGYLVETTTQNAPYDLIVNKNIRIDVKSGCAYDLRGSRVHSFGINKPFPNCDLYIIYALNENAKDIERIFIIPSYKLKLQMLSIGANSKYNKYIDRWDYIEKYNEFYKSLFINE